MRIQGNGWIGGAALALALVGPAHATTIGGGGNQKTDCLAVLQTPVALPEGQRKNVCTDGDPACDADATVDGQCTFALSVCANSSFDPKCTLTGVDSIFVEHSADNGDPDFDPDFQALQDRIENEIDLPGSDEECTGNTLLTVPLRGPLPGKRCLSGRKRVRMSTESEFDPMINRIIEDKDSMKLICRPPPGECDPAELFDGTYDRIQRQIFDQSCAVSACHDSESFAGGLLLESGASYDSLVNETPSNFAAQQLGWLRVNPRDPTTSFIDHKLSGDLGPGLGARMPFGRPKLSTYLREIIRAWIVGGALETGWAPGTDQ
ncbi:MAG: hypothetical protein FJ144_10345 [Deltaproteobacteria bacterium]|nr:hypothetical protein [Deltaproteobacteria bacterium]